MNLIRLGSIFRLNFIVRKPTEGQFFYLQIKIRSALKNLLQTEYRTPDANRLTLISRIQNVYLVGINTIRTTQELLHTIIQTNINLNSTTNQTKSPLHRKRLTIFRNLFG